jgi:hypothetical protein
VEHHLNLLQEHGPVHHWCGISYLTILQIFLLRERF